ncbi:MAG: ABC transporter permease [Chloroflexia bacterium]|nr:ABC transporter permease [Chloroflexia bacterium]MDQ3513803.1 ABC transporter permease [Chloroflexota bacterium]
MSRELGRVRQQRSLWGNAWRQFRRHRLAMVGTVVLLFLILATLFGPFLYGRATDIPFEYTSSQRPSLDNLLGTDSLGQDVLARILWGGRISIAVGLIAAAVSIVLGTAIGAISGFFGGVTDALLMRITDMFISLPQLPLLLLVSFLFKNEMVTLFEDRFGAGNLGVFVLIVGVIGILNWMPTARLVRASFLAMKEKEFVEAARSIGATRSNIIFRHILPNVLSPIIVAATLGVGEAIITESSLSFLGLGFPSDVPTWGRMLFEAKDYLQLSPHESLIPGTMIFLTVLSINYMGDGLRDALDPRKSQ